MSDMTLDELRDALLGLYTYDTGMKSIGIHDEVLRARCVDALNRLPRPTPSYLYAPDLSRIVRDLCLTEEAISAGYGIEDAIEFVRWLGDRMEQPEL